MQEKEREITDQERKLKHHAEMEKNRDREVAGLCQQKNKLENDLQVIIEEMGTGMFRSCPRHRGGQGAVGGRIERKEKQKINF